MRRLAPGYQFLGIRHECCPVPEGGRAIGRARSSQRAACHTGEHGSSVGTRAACRTRRIVRPGYAPCGPRTVAGNVLARTFCPELAGGRRARVTRAGASDSAGHHHGGACAPRVPAVNGACLRCAAS
eukprot:6214727-Pleurochrysis_carterae.AAC.1